ncbi:MAG: hypothetical protein ACR2HJ_02150 [Fimbriimonadales bacterium]
MATRRATTWMALGVIIISALAILVWMINSAEPLPRADYPESQDNQIVPSEGQVKIKDTVSPYKTPAKPY